MAGWFLDIWLGYLIRVGLRFWQHRESGRWSRVSAKLVSVFCNIRGWGGYTVDVSYDYKIDGVLYPGSTSIPFLSSGLAKIYAREHGKGNTLMVRVKPAYLKRLSCCAETSQTRRWANAPLRVTGSGVVS